MAKSLLSTCVFVLLSGVPLACSDDVRVNVYDNRADSPLEPMIYTAGSTVVVQVSSDPHPLAMIDAASMCSDQIFYNQDGVLTTGTAVCSTEADTLAKIIPDNIKAGISIGGVEGTYEGRPANCSSDGQSAACVAHADFPAADTSNLSSRLLSGQTLAGITGSMTAESHANCNAGGQVGCIAIAPYLTMDLSLASVALDLNASNFSSAMASAASFEFWDSQGLRHAASGDADLNPANIAAGVNILGVLGTASLESHSDCTGANQSACIATSSYRTMNLSLAGTGSAGNVNAGNFALRLGSSGSFEYWDADGERHILMGDTSLQPSRIASGVEIFGVTGSAGPEVHSPCTAALQTGCASTSIFKTMDLSAATGRTDLSSGNFDTAISTAADFEFWDSTGAHFIVAGDSDLTAARFVSGANLFGVTGSATAESHSLCTAAAQTGCVASADFKTIDLSLADGTVDLSSTNFASSVVTAANFEFWDANGARHVLAGDADLAASNVRNTVNIFGIPGTMIGETHSACTASNQSGCVVAAPYQTMDFSLADGSTDLNSSNFDSAIATAASFEFWDSTGARHLVTGDADLVAGNLKSGVEVHGATGSLTMESHSSCNGAAQSGCVATPSYKTLDLSAADASTDLTAANFESTIRTAGNFEFWDINGARHVGTGDTDLAVANFANAVVIHGVTGTATIESHSNCNAANQSGCLATANFQTMNLTLADGTTDLTAANFAATIASAADFEFWDSTGVRHLVSGDSDLSTGQVKSGEVIHGVTGAYPSATYRLPSASATSDLTSSTFDAQMTAATAFEYWSSDGAHQAGAGDADITAANIVTGTTIFAVTGSLASASNCGYAVQGSCEADLACEWTGAVCQINPWNIRIGTTIAGVSGALKVSCRNRANSAIYNADTLPLGSGADTSGSTVDWWDTIDDFNNNAAVPTTLVAGWTTDTDCGTSVWQDLTADGACNAAADDCIIKDRISGLQWSESYPVTGVDANTTSLNWSAAVQHCDSLTFGTKSDWRLATQKELMDAYNHGIRAVGYNGTGTIRNGGNSLDNNDHFIKVVDNSFWSASSYSTDSSKAWRTSLDDGNTGSLTQPKTNTKLVICVRP